jgi:DNA-binding MarR family transcriptional regulator
VTCQLPNRASAARALAAGHYDSTYLMPWQERMAEQNHRSLTAAQEADFIARFIGARKNRATLLSASLFADPAWDIVLELFLAELEGRKLATSELGYAANVPMTTSLRWIEKLETDGWVRRDRDAHDLRRSFVELSARGSEAMHVWVRDWLEQSSKRSDDDRVTDLLSRIERDGSTDKF